MFCPSWTLIPSGIDPLLPFQLPLILRAFAGPPADPSAMDLAAMLSGSAGGGSSGGAAGAAGAAAPAGASGGGASSSLDAALPDHIRELGYQVIHFLSKYRVQLDKLNVQNYN